MCETNRLVITNNKDKVRHRFDLPQDDYDYYFFYINKEGREYRAAIRSQVIEDLHNKEFYHAIQQLNLSQDYDYKCSLHELPKAIEKFIDLIPEYNPRDNDEAPLLDDKRVKEFLGSR